MVKSRKKKLLLTGLSLIFLYAVWLCYHLVSYKAYSFSSDLPQSEGVVGVYHVHTTFSDGRKSLEEITKIASGKSLDFIILADHGNPNHKSLLSQGWYHNVLVLAGSELSVNRGHLVALGFEVPSQPFSQNAEEAAVQIHRAGGFSIIAHPYSKTRWTWGDYADFAGIEVINADTMLKIHFPAMLPYIPLLAVKPELPLLKLLNSPEKNLRKWDELNQDHIVYGFYSTDAHVLYNSLFSFLHLHLGTRDPLPQDFLQARQAVLNALRQGNFYNAVDAAAQARGFRYFARKDKEIIPMGRTLRFDPPMSLHVELPPGIKCETSLIRDGIPALSSTEQSFSHEVRRPGTYRVEVYLREKTPLNPSCPWILSNPIFIRESTS